MLRGKIMAREVKKMSVRLNFFENEGFDFQLMRSIGLHYYGGASIGECLSTAKRIKDGDVVSWANEWNATAKMVEEEAEVFMEKDETISAREAYLRASMYYRAAEYFGFFSEPSRRENWEKSKECFQKAAKFFEATCEIIEISFEDMKLPGYFIRPDENSEKRPTLLIMSGFDGTAEELYFYLGVGAVAKGYNVLLFEGPGQVGPIHIYPEKPFRPDYEVPVKTIVDYVLLRDDVDEERLALVGFSLGGYFASRAVVYEKRIKACVVDSPVIDISRYYKWFGNLEEIAKIKEEDYGELFSKHPFAHWGVETFTRRYGTKTVAEALDKIKEFNIVNDLNKITCPTLSLVGEGEGDEAIFQAQRFYEDVSGPKAFRMFTEKEGAESHCQITNLSLMNAIVMTWLDGVFSK